jgi:hypothetical protein
LCTEIEEIYFNIPKRCGKPFYASRFLQSITYVVESIFSRTSEREEWRRKSDEEKFYSG